MADPLPSDREDLDPSLPQDFETALLQLEELVASMESGALPLEESLAAYRRGVALTRICQERLAQAEQQVKVLEAGMLKPFEGLDREAS
ncbi:MAG: exodeoxyribonuclease VII small subunit [Burkholderiaceae bacterium]|nr:exodeoxyribonuclease VII small subunit [Burkholderiaceae bacterium]